jgi:hypothetical protein
VAQGQEQRIAINPAILAHAKLAKVAKDEASQPWKTTELSQNSQLSQSQPAESQELEEGKL